jgi:hypothetical protein
MGFVKLANSLHITGCVPSQLLIRCLMLHSKDLLVAASKTKVLSWCCNISFDKATKGQNLSKIYMCSNFSLRNSSTLSVFQLRMLSSSAMFPLSSKSFSTGSEPRTYLICSPLNSLGLSLLMKAWTWGNLPNFHPQTSRISPAYSFLVSDCASSWQHPLQSGSSWSRLNCPRRSQELQSKLLEKPNSLHASDENSAPKADTWK